jgi:tetratricopeptide (TPR) repeat protein
MFVRYDEFVKEMRYNNASLVLDSIEQILKTTQGYADSYELGIVLNNRASVYISKALYETDDSLQKQYLLDTAIILTHNCIDYYNKWNDRFGKLSKKEILEEVQPSFRDNDEAFQELDYKKILSKRVDDIVLAQKETPRRLSVAYTNLGIIQRHQYEPAEAVESYRKAIELWKDNPAALGNLNVLFGKPYSDRSIIKKIFPPERTDG